MPVSDTDYQITIRTSADLKGAEEAIQSLSRQSLEARAAGRDYSELEKQIGKLKNGVSSYKALEEAAKGAEISHRAWHQSIHLVGEASAGALGPIGELAHFMANPYIMAFAGATLAVKMLVEQHEEKIKAEKESLTASDEMRKMFKDGIAKGAEEAADKIADLSSAHEHLTDNTDKATEALDREQRIERINTDAAKEQTGAYESLAEAKIRAAEAEGKISKTDADQQVQTAKRDAEKQKEFEEQEAAKKTVAEKRERANSAATEGAAALETMRGLQPKLETTDAAVITQEGRVKQLQDAAAKAREKAIDLRAQADNHSVLTPGYAQAQIDARHAGEAADKAEEVADEQVKHLAALKHEQKELNREADSAAKLADERDATARKLKEEADQLEKETAAKHEAFQSTMSINEHADRVNQRTGEINRIKQLGEKNNRSPEEEREFQDLQTRFKEEAATNKRGNLGRETSDLVSKANAAISHAQNGHGSREEIHNVLQRIIGHTQSNVTETAAVKAQMTQLQRRLDELDHLAARNVNGL